MTGGIHIRVRRGAGKPASETMYIGEPMWDTTGMKLGVYNGGSDVEWYPEVRDNLVTLLQNTQLSGYDSNNARSIGLDFSVPETLRIVNFDTEEVYATFEALGAGGASFNSATVGTAAKYGWVNDLINGSLLVLGDQGTGPWSTNLVSGLHFAPNWRFYKTSTTAGTMEVRILTDPTLRPYPESGNVIQVNASGMPNSSGIRTFLFDPKSYETRTITASYELKGPAGATCRARFVYGGLSQDFAFTGTGSWERVTATWTVPTNAANVDYIAFEPIWRPSDGIWQGCAFQIERGSDQTRWVARPQYTEEVLSTPIYRKFNNIPLTGTNPTYFPLTPPMAITPQNRLITTTVSPVTALNITATEDRVELQAPTAAPTDNNTASLVVAVEPVTPDTA